MPRRPKYWQMVQASKSEMLLAVDLWNRRGPEVSTSACIVHSQIAWLYLCHARCESEHIDYWCRKDGRRQRGSDGEFRAWELQRCVRELFPHPEDGTRRNIEFFIGIRNKIEHRWERGLAVLFAGKIQALILNYERVLKDWFKDSLADELRFPIFLSSLSEEAQRSVALIWESLPQHLTSYIRTFDEDVPDDLCYEFNVALIPYTGSKAGSLVSMTFVRAGDLTDEQRSALQEIVTVIRDKQVPVQHLGELKPSDVAGRVQAALGFRFTTTPHHSSAWRYFDVRPGPGDPHPERTDSRYCQYSAAFKSYVYAEAWVKKLVTELRDVEAFFKVTGQAPAPI